ncbi:hypothetical protein GO496_04100 [Acidovorax citrulli]|nr:hypothetical protein [Paracidovorax citrulli]
MSTRTSPRCWACTTPRRALPQAQRRGHEVTRQLGREIDTWRALYARARRALDKLGTSAEEASVALIKTRHSGSEARRTVALQKRDTSSPIASGRVRYGRPPQFKAKVRHPDHGAPFAP